MRKTDKKIDNALIAVLNEACELAQDDYPGFKWLTHFANYNYFPGSLSVVCVYDTNENLENTNTDAVRLLIKEKLASINIKLKDIRQQISFDTEESCKLENNGKWHERCKWQR